MSSIIKPTVGRVVLVKGPNIPPEGWPALITAVWSDFCINVAGFTTGGSPFARSSLELAQEGRPIHSLGEYAEWMPFQKGQAAKTEALAAQLAGQAQRQAGMSMDAIARVCHEVNRAYCQALGDMSQPTWEDAPERQRASARMGVDLHMVGDFGPEASHASWMQQKLAEGWTLGPVKDPAKKEHPCMVPFDQLPREQQAKDFIFRAVVHALRGL